MAREDSQPCVRLRAPSALICDAKQVQGDENLHCITNRAPSTAIFASVSGLPWVGGPFRAENCVSAAPTAPPAPIFGLETC